MKAVATQLDLPWLSAVPAGIDVTNYLTKMLEFLEQANKRGRISRVLRFFAFKTTMGMDMYPSPTFSLSNLLEPSGDSYSSVSLTGPAIVQGVFIPQEIGDLLQEDDILRDYLDTVYQQFR